MSFVALKTTAVTGLAALALFLGGSSIVPDGSVDNAHAQTEQDGLVNVSVGDVTILEDVNIGIAANVAANICGVNVGPVAVLGQAVDRSGDSTTVCTVDDQAVTLEQN